MPGSSHGWTPGPGRLTPRGDPLATALGAEPVQPHQPGRGDGTGPGTAPHRNRASPLQPPQRGAAREALDAAESGRREPVHPQLERHRNQLAGYEKLCRELGAGPAEVALAWLLRNPAVSATLVGPRTVEELRGALGAVSVQLDAGGWNGSTGSGPDQAKPRRPMPDDQARL
ncbi:aldo/keto reductase [Arthrobacter sp. OAP107]|uniref:aldo/keto reductase n=1 Tax=Arthrobacter sp. OAP107 TaxID=3156445 RepID=UPI0033911A28